jgi:PST family polysaccharide transporter
MSTGTLEAATPPPSATRFASAVVARSAVWRVIEIAGGEGLTFAFTLVMARLLGPADFGLVAIATVTVTLALLLVRYGLAEAVIQHPRLTDRHVHTALWANLGLGLAASLLVAAAALPLATVAGKPDLAPILLALAPLGLVHAVTYLCVGLLRRRLDYRGLALRALLATLLSYLLGIGLALAGLGPWALVAVQLTNGLVSALTVLVASGYRPRAVAGRAEARELAAVAVPVVGQALPNAAATAAVLTLGVFLPASAVGLFYLAERLVQSLLMLTGGSVADLSLPVLARLQGAREAQVAAARQAIRLAGLVCLPTFLGVALVAEPLVLVLLGEGWRGAVPALRVLALAGVALGLAAVAGQILIAAGHPRSALLANALTLVPAAAATAALAPFGLVPALLARVVVQLGCLAAVARLLGRRLGIGAGALLADLVPCLAATGAMALVLVALPWLLGGGLPPLARLGLEVAAGALSFGLALRLLDRALCAGLWTTLRSALGRGRPAAAGETAADR